ncbi:MAG: hypothetical protein Tp138OMZ00d2C19078261_81 [Prokaryotic dsDNA virus sp.]|jgi:hypothetical protein|nr:MAG: hypothetical protein Tp138OMZ00d2C19078261_81 [Prokaryotic dsDNA virus sp.]|tara:strand:- start:5644 stop:5883 length:240 start_codon:yes stop_codon:yes gene_type:complete
MNDHDQEHKTGPQLVKFPSTEDGIRSVEETLEKAKKRGLTEVVVLGFDEDDEHVVLASTMLNKDILWHGELLRKFALGD